jgi:hypothetical protein
LRRRAIVRGPFVVLRHRVLFCGHLLGVGAGIGWKPEGLPATVLIAFIGVQ